MTKQAPGNLKAIQVAGKVLSYLTPKVVPTDMYGVLNREHIDWLCPLRESGTGLVGKWSMPMRNLTLLRHRLENARQAAVYFMLRPTSDQEITWNTGYAKRALTQATLPHETAIGRGSGCEHYVDCFSLEEQSIGVWPHRGPSNPLAEVTFIAALAAPSCKR